MVQVMQENANGPSPFADSMHGSHQRFVRLQSEAPFNRWTHRTEWLKHPTPLEYFAFPLQASFRPKGRKNSFESRRNHGKQLFGTRTKGHPDLKREHI